MNFRETVSQFIAPAISVQIVSTFVSFFRFITELSASVCELDLDLPMWTSRSLPFSFFISY